MVREEEELLLEPGLRYTVTASVAMDGCVLATTAPKAKEATVDARDPVAQASLNKYRLPRYLRGGGDNSALRFVDGSDMALGAGRLVRGMCCGSLVDGLNAHLRAHRGDATAMNKLGWLQEHYLGRVDAAVTQYRAALTADPKLVEAHTNLAAAVLKQGAGDGPPPDSAKHEARVHIEQALQLSPENAATHNTYGMLLHAAFQDHDAARKSFEEAIRLNPTFAMAHCNLAGLLEEREPVDIVGAREHYETALRAEPNMPSAHHNLASLLAGKFPQDAELARHHFEEAIRLNPQMAESHANLATLLVKRFNDYAAAKRCYESALRVDPGNATARANLTKLTEFYGVK